MMQYVDTLESYLHECHMPPLVTGASVYCYPGVLTLLPYYGTSKVHGIHLSIYIVNAYHGVKECILYWTVIFTVSSKVNIQKIWSEFLKII